MVTVTAPAKVNLFLKVNRRRDDGYHDIESLICPVGIYDRVTITIGSRRSEVMCRHPAVPEDDTNLAMRAAAIFFQSLTVDGPPAENVRINIEKRIPVGAGLGGGSSDAAAVLKGLNRHYRQPFSPRKLCDLAGQIGADVPFFIKGHAALATGIGDILEPIKGLRPFHLVIIYPGFPISTAMVYSKLNLRLTKCEKKLKCLDFRKRKFNLPDYLCNDLEPVVTAQFPIIQTAKNLLENCGARGTLMTGSGSSVFGIFEDAQLAQTAAKKASQREPRPW